MLAHHFFAWFQHFGLIIRFLPVLLLFGQPSRSEWGEKEGWGGGEMGLHTSMAMGEVEGGLGGVLNGNDEGGGGGDLDSDRDDGGAHRDGRVGGGEDGGEDGGERSWHLWLVGRLRVRGRGSRVRSVLAGVRLNGTYVGRARGVKGDVEERGVSGGVTERGVKGGVAPMGEEAADGYSLKSPREQLEVMSPPEVFNGDSAMGEGSKKHDKIS